MLKYPPSIQIKITYFNASDFLFFFNPSFKPILWSRVTLFWVLALVDNQLVLINPFYSTAMSTLMTFVKIELWPKKENTHIFTFNKKSLKVQSLYCGQLLPNAE